MLQVKASLSWFIWSGLRSLGLYLCCSIFNCWLITLNDCLMVCRFLVESILPVTLSLYFVCSTLVSCKLYEQLLLSLKPGEQWTVIIWRCYSVSNMPLVVVLQPKLSARLQLLLCSMTSQLCWFWAKASVLKQKQLVWNLLCFPSHFFWLFLDWNWLK